MKGYNRTNALNVISCVSAYMYFPSYPCGVCSSTVIQRRFVCVYSRLTECITTYEIVVGPGIMMSQNVRPTYRQSVTSPRHCASLCTALNLRCSRLFANYENGMCTFYQIDSSPQCVGTIRHHNYSPNNTKHSL